MKTLEYTYGPVVLNLYMNGEAMFQIQVLDNELPEGQPDALARMLENSAGGFEALCRIAEILATQGELCRRYLQYMPRRIPSARELLLLLSPVQMTTLRSKVIAAINAGYEQTDDESDGDIDTGLAELEKKTQL